MKKFLFLLTLSAVFLIWARLALAQGGPAWVLYVVNSDADAVSVVDVRAQKVIALVPVGRNPGGSSTQR
ncbi:MAG TPA: hypothetical protein VGB25_10960 [Candidatus Binatia bacterium]